MTQFVAVDMLDNPPQAALAYGVFDLDPLSAQTAVALFLGLGQLAAFGLFDRYAQIVQCQTGVGRVGFFPGARIDFNPALAENGDVGLRAAQMRVAVLYSVNILIVNDLNLDYVFFSWPS